MPAWARELTLNDLMHHTSGIKDFLGLPLSNFGPSPLNNDDILDFVRTSPLAQLGTPGEFSYSNTNYTLLADIVAGVTGVDFTEWMETNVFAPLDIEARIGPLAASDPVGYEDYGAEYRVVEPLPWDVVGPISVTMTVSDLTRWGDQFRAPSLLTEDSLAKALSEGTPVGDGFDYGPGVFVAADGSLGHEGVGAGHHTLFEVSPDRHTAVAIACNQDGIDIVSIHGDLKTVWMAGLS